MAQFSKIIGTILCDVIQAQHEANLYAGRLCEEYRKGGKAAGLHLPHATIGDIELTLKYGIENGESKREQFETDYRGLYVFLKSFSSQMENPLKLVPFIHSNLTPVKFFHSSILIIPNHSCFFLILFVSYTMFYIKFRL